VTSPLPGIEHAVTLTARQALALAFCRSIEGPVQGDEIGAALHEDRLARGGRGHSRDERCQWCGDEGRDMARTLVGKGVLKRVSGGFEPREREGERPPSSQIGPDDEWPEEMFQVNPGKDGK
jgi:hypothetical protein